MTFRIVFTGGGSAGHVTPNIALIDELLKEGWQVDYIGSAKGVENAMLNELRIPYHPIKSGKLRRYFSWKNFIDPFNTLIGMWQAYWLLRELKPHVVFSKGGFVAFPVVVGAWLNKIPIVAHESDMSPGLANRLSFPFVNKICVTFLGAKDHFKATNKVVVTGTPIRKALFLGLKEQGLALCGLSDEKPCLLFIGGSLGAQTINRTLRQALPELLKTFQVIHLCGKGKIDPALQKTEGFCQFEYANEELAHLFAASSLVVSRAGANSLYEILALAKPHVLIPLPLAVSRGDQVQNAHFFEKMGISVVLNESELTATHLVQAIDHVFLHLDDIKHKIEALDITSATAKVIDVIKEQAHVESASTSSVH